MFMRRTTTILAALTLPSLAVMAQAPSLTLNGDSSGDRYGFAVALVGDTNNDGVSDMLLGAPFDDGTVLGSGVAYLLSGTDGSVLHTFEGAASGDEFGRAVAGLGDINGDGLHDVIVGASFGGTNSGGYAVVYSGDGTVLFTKDGAALDDGFGVSVSAAGDANGDGYLDFAVGAPGDDTNGADAGSATVWSGLDGALLYRVDGGAGDGLGEAVGGGGDTNGDCLDDIIVGAPAAGYNGVASGRFLIVSGDGTVLHTVDGDTAGDRLGFAVADTGDTNGDGNDDVVVSAAEASYAAAFAGRVLVYSGIDVNVQHTIEGESANEAFGWCVAGAGDIDNDGFADFAAAAPWAGFGGPASGRVRAFSGANGTPLRTIDGPTIGGRFGFSISGIGDTNLDGYPELLAGAPNNNENGENSGAALLFSAAPLDGFGSRVTEGVGELSLYGFSVNSAGDVNNDGIGDYLVGAPGMPSPYARVHSGADHSIIHQIDGKESNGETGYACDGVGDLNGDGFDEFAVGSPHYSAFVVNGGRLAIHDGLTGAIYTSGSTTFEWFKTFNAAHLGYDVAGAGDVNNDGVPDLISGVVADNENRSGSAVVYSGADGSLLYEFDGDGQDDFLGWSVAAAGDINGDGHADLLVSATENFNAGVQGPGYVRLYSGLDGSEIYTVSGVNTLDLFGFSLAGNADVNADGVPDFVVGAQRTDFSGMDAGSAYVFSGVDGSELYRFDGEAAGDDFGRSVALADLDADGHADIMVGAPLHDINGVPDVGRVYTFSGRDGSPMGYLLDGVSENTWFPRALHAIPDIDGDNLPEILAGSPRGLVSGSINGLIFVYESSTRPAGWFREYGPTCPGSNGSLPRISGRGMPVLGQNFDVELSSATPSRVAFASFDVSAKNSPLVSAPGCVMLSSPAISFPAWTNPMGKASIVRITEPSEPSPLAGRHPRPNPVPRGRDIQRGVDVPVWAGLIGQSVYVQWWVLDAGANALGVATSDALCATIGR